MHIVNCIRCKQTFAMTNQPICPDCIAKEEEQFEEVKAFLDENRGATIEEIVEGTEIPLKRIQKWLKDGRLEGIEGSGLKCAKCGIPLTKGKYCDSCAKKLHDNLNTFRSGGELEGGFQEKAKLNLMKAKNRGH